jgi:hypothetical protein
MTIELIQEQARVKTHTGRLALVHSGCRALGR